MESTSIQSTIVSESFQNPFIDKVTTFIDFFEKKLKSNNFEEEVLFFEKNKDLMEKNNKLVINKGNLINYISAYHYFQFLLSGTHYFKFNFIIDKLSDFNEIIRNLTKTDFNFPKFEGTIIYQKTIYTNINLYTDEQITFNLYRGQLNKNTYIYEKTETQLTGVLPNQLKRAISGGRDDIYIFEINPFGRNNEDRKLKFILQFVFYRMDTNNENFTIAIEDLKKDEQRSVNNNFLNKFKIDIIKQYFRDEKDIITNLNFNRNHSELAIANNINIFACLPVNSGILRNLYAAFNPIQRGKKTIVIKNILACNLSNFLPNQTMDRFESLSALFNNTENKYLIDIFEQNYLKTLHNYLFKIKAHLFLIYDIFGINFTGILNIPTNEELETFLESINTFASERSMELKEQNLNEFYNIIDREKKKIKKYMDDQFVIIEGDLKKIAKQFNEIIDKLKSYSETFIENLQNELNCEYNNRIINFLRKRGITSDCFNKIATILRERIRIDNPFILMLDRFEGQLQEIFIRFGISVIGGIVAGVAGFVLARAGTTIAADAAAGTLGGPIGIGVGVVVGVGSFAGQLGYVFSKNRQKALSLYNECANLLEGTREFIQLNVEMISKNNFEGVKDMAETEVTIIKMILKYCRQINIVKDFYEQILE